LDLYKTPLGDIQLDRESNFFCSFFLSFFLSYFINYELVKGYSFTNKDDEEDEHSLELHLPFIYKMLKDKPFKLVPIMIG